MPRPTLVYTEPRPEAAVSQLGANILIFTLALGGCGWPEKPQKMGGKKLSWRRIRMYDHMWWPLYWFRSDVKLAESRCKFAAASGGLLSSWRIAWMSKLLNTSILFASSPPFAKECELSYSIKRYTSLPKELFLSQTILVCLDLV